MIIGKPPYFQKNKDWFYIDPRKCMTRLTDKATSKAIESYVEHYCRLEGMPVSLDDEQFKELEKDIRERTRQDIKEYRENKSRYEFQIDERGNHILIKIDGNSVI